MEDFDYEKAARVWQRVQSREPLEPLRQDPAALRQLALELAALYQALSRALPGQDGERARQLRREAGETAACLRGLCAVSGRPAPESSPVRAPKEPPRRLIEKCAHRERRLIDACAKNTADPEWGRIYASLAAAAEKRCIMTLSLLGGLDK